MISVPKVLPEISEVKYTQLADFLHFNNIPIKNSSESGKFYQPVKSSTV